MRMIAKSSVFAKIFNTWNADIIETCQYYSRCLPLKYLLSLRRFEFLKKIYNDTDVQRQAMFDCFTHDEVKLIASKYDLALTDSKYFIKVKVNAYFAKSLIERQLLLTE